METTVAITRALQCSCPSVTPQVFSIGGKGVEQRVSLGTHKVRLSQSVDCQLKTAGESLYEVHYDKLQSNSSSLNLRHSRGGSKRGDLVLTTTASFHARDHGLFSRRSSHQRRAASLPPKHGSLGEQHVPHSSSVCQKWLKVFLNLSRSSSSSSSSNEAAASKKPFIPGHRGWGGGGGGGGGGQSGGGGSGSSGRGPWTLLAAAALGLALVLGAPTLPNTLSAPTAWALTEENLVFLEAWRVVDRAYVDKSFNGQSWFRYRENALKNTPMVDRDQTYAAIRKMLASLDDPFTRFLEPEKLATLRSGTKGSVTGIGLEVGFDAPDGELVVVSPVSGGPADRAGIAPGDTIKAIGGTSTRGMGLYEAAQKLQGLPQTEVQLTVEHPGGGSGSTRSPPSSFDISLMREKIEINPVTWKACETSPGGPTLGYIRLTTFNSNSAGAVREAIKNLRNEGASAFVLDIRNNSGGLFPAGVEIAKMWLDKGVIVYIADSMGVRDIYDTEGEYAIATEEPLAVLVNKGTASASEILAGALKDNKRATILGQPTFGKGKIQSVFELSDGSGLAVTIARYETPSHIDIDKVGITPDKPLPDNIPINSEGFCSCIRNPTAESSFTLADLFPGKNLSATKNAPVPALAAAMPEPNSE